MSYIRLNECGSLMRMAEQCILHPSAKPAFVDTDTLMIIANEFPAFKETARIFWKGNFKTILSEDEENEALEAWIHIRLYLDEDKEPDNIFIDCMVLIKYAAKMICRANMNK